MAKRKNLKLRTSRTFRTSTIGSYRNKESDSINLAIDTINTIEPNTNKHDLTDLQRSALILIKLAVKQRLIQPTINIFNKLKLLN